MWTESTMELGQSLTISAMGMMVVVAELAILAVAIVILSKIIGAIESKNKKPVAKAAGNTNVARTSAPVANAIDEDAHAVLLCAVSEETRLPIDSFTITQIKEV